LQSQKMESLGTLAGGVAHDFNNILNLILGYATSMERNADAPAKLADNILVIKETVKRGASLVRQLLSIVRKTDILFEPIEINNLLEKLQPLLRETFPKTIDVSLELGADLPAVMADMNQLNQVMLNLCVNARDAMPGGGKLTLTTARVTGADLRGRFQDAIEKEYLSLSVADTGLGMDETIRNRIFEPFFSTKDPGQGTGLGLSVVYGIVRNHGGFVDVTSEHGKGSTFCVYLPVLKDQIPTVNVMVPLHVDGNERAQRPSMGETILFVEDEAKQLKLMESFLEREGYRVLGAKDGLEAVEIFSRHKQEIAAVVLDIGLPRLNGWEAFLRMKQETTDVKVLFATGYMSPEIQAGIERGEFSGVIMKPYQLDDVLAKIAGAIQSSASLSKTAGMLNDKPPLA
jgi:two-component system, cell cycle sensor histidine kinase and response regulator CckA